MELGTIRDFTHLAIAIGTTAVSVIGVYFRFKYKLRLLEMRVNGLDGRIDKRIEECNKKCDIKAGVCDKRMSSIEKTIKSIDRKFLVIEKNLTKILEKLEIEPVRDLFRNGEE